MYVLFALGACAVGMATIIVDVSWSPPPSSLVPSKLSTNEADDSSFFSTRRVCMVSYRSNKTIGSSLIEHSGSADLAGMVVMDTANEGTVRKADLM